MAIDDEAFYNQLGEEISRGYLVEQMIGYYDLKREIGETRITDFSEGSEVRNLLESIAVDCYVLMQEQNELTKVGFIDSAEGEYLDKHGANPFINLPRNQGTEATGYVTFSIPEEISSDVIIPEGTVVVCEDTGLEYGTDVEGVISVGDTETTVACTCLSTGKDGNCGINMITVLDDDYIDIVGVTVTNTEKFRNGTDYEEDDEYRERLLKYVRQDDFGSLPYYTNLANSIEGVHDALLINTTGYTKKILVNGYTKPTPNTLLLDVLETFTNTNNIVVGHTFTVDKPTYVEADLDINLTVSVEIAESKIISLITTFFNGGDADLPGLSFSGYSIGQSVTKTELYNALSLIEAIQEIEVLDHDSQTEITDLEVGSDEVIKVGSLEITQTVAE